MAINVKNLVRAREIPKSDVHVNLLVQGRSGSGKTTLGADMPNPLILLTEANGLPSILAKNPDAVVIKVYAPQEYGLESGYDVIMDVVKTAMARGFDELGIESIVMDSATEAQRLLKEQILREKGVLQNPGYVFTQQDWGLLTERSRRMIRALRDLPYHTLVITLSTEERDEEGGISSISPQFEGKKLAGDVMQFFSACGLAFKRTVKAEGQPEAEVFEVMFSGPTKYCVKPCKPLARIEPHDPQGWIRRIVEFDPTAAKDVPASTNAPAEAPAETKPATDPKPAAETPEKPATDKPAETEKVPKRRTVGG